MANTPVVIANSDSNDLTMRANAFVYAMGKFFAELEIYNGAVIDIENNGGYDEEFLEDRFASLDDLKPEILRVMKEEIEYQKAQHPEYFPKV